jgi:hypothetical protein
MCLTKLLYSQFENRNQIWQANQTGSCYRIQRPTQGKIQEEKVTDCFSNDDSHLDNFGDRYRIVYCWWFLHCCCLLVG